MRRKQNGPAAHELWTVHEWVCRLAEELPALDAKTAHDQVLGPGASSKAGLIYRAIKDSIRSGTLPALPMGWYGHWRLKPTDAIKWATDCGYELPANISSPEPVPDRQGHQVDDSRSPADTANWILRVQEQAAVIWKHWRKVGANPTKLAIQDELAKWCRDKGVTTPTNINPSARYIYRHALQKWKPPKDSAG